MSDNWFELESRMVTVQGHTTASIITDLFCELEIMLYSIFLNE